MTNAHAAANRTCPECGHHTSGCIGGVCTAIVAAPADDPLGRLAVYCGCDCVKVITGKSLAIGISGDLESEDDPECE